MSRRTFAFAVAVLIVPLCQAGQTTGILPGEKFEGSLTGKATSVDLRTNPRKGKVGRKAPFVFHDAYSTQIPITVKEGARLSVTVTVTGTERKVALGLLDPDGKVISAMKSWSDTRTAKLEVEEVNASGKYKIVVVSDLIGKFTLRASGPAAKVLGVKELREKLRRLKEEVAETEKLLKEAEAKAGVKE
jgi:hypothetical protein